MNVAMAVIQFLRPRISLREYAQLVWSHVRKRPLLWTLIASFSLAGAVFGHFYRLAFNLTPSVPYHVFIVEKSPPLPGTLKRNEIVAWLWPGGLYYGEGALFVKFVKGLPGDRVEARGNSGRDMYVNGEYVGTAKRVSRFGDALPMNKPGIVPPGRYYLYAPHRDSLDSRYAATGFVPLGRIVGRAHVVF